MRLRPRRRRRPMSRTPVSHVADFAYKPGLGHPHRVPIAAPGVSTSQGAHDTIARTDASTRSVGSGDCVNGPGVGVGPAPMSDQRDRRDEGDETVSSVAFVSRARRDWTLIVVKPMTPDRASARVLRKGSLRLSRPQTRRQPPNRPCRGARPPITLGKR